MFVSDWETAGIEKARCSSSAVMIVFSSICSNPAADHNNFGILL